MTKSTSPCTVVDTPEQIYPIRPSDVHLRENGNTGLSTFGLVEIEMAAGHLVSFFQDSGGWCPFTIEDLYAYYEGNEWDASMMFYGLVGDYLHPHAVGHDWRTPRPYLVLYHGGKYVVTNVFVEHAVGLIETRRD